MSMRWWRHATGPALTMRRLRPRTRGQALVELAIILPVLLLLLLLLLAALDLGRIYFTGIYDRKPLTSRGAPPRRRRPGRVGD